MQWSSILLLISLETLVLEGGKCSNTRWFQMISTQSSKNKYACKNRKLDQQPGNKKKPYYISSSFQHYCTYFIQSPMNSKLSNSSVVDRTEGAH